MTEIVEPVLHLVSAAKNDVILSFLQMQKKRGLICVTQSGVSRSLHMYIFDDMSFFKYEREAALYSRDRLADADIQ